MNDEQSSSKLRSDLDLRRELTQLLVDKQSNLSNSIENLSESLKSFHQECADKMLLNRQLREEVKPYLPGNQIDMQENLLRIEHDLSKKLNDPILGLANANFTANSTIQCKGCNKNFPSRIYK